MKGSVTRRRPISVAEGPRRARAVAVLAPTADAAARAIRALAGRIPAARLEASTLDAYLARADAPARVVFCVTGSPRARAEAFLRRAAARLLWPAPPADVYDAVAGLREPRHRPRRLPPESSGAEPSSRPAALLLEGSVDAARARAALASAPRAWIVENARRVQLSPRQFTALARAGVTWTALEPIELVGIYAESEPAQKQLPPGAKIWLRRTPGAGARRESRAARR